MAFHHDDQVLRRMYPPCGAGKDDLAHVIVYDVAHARHTFDVLAPRVTHYDPSPVVVLGPGDLAGVEVDLTLDVDQVLVEVKLGAVQREDFAGAQRLVADRKDCSLKDEPVIIGAAVPCALLESCVLLVGNDLEVGPVDSALALARPEVLAPACYRWTLRKT
jgi:hypothetical protein